MVSQIFRDMISTANPHKHLNRKPETPMRRLLLTAAAPLIALCLAIPGARATHAAGCSGGAQTLNATPSISSRYPIGFGATAFCPGAAGITYTLVIKSGPAIVAVRSVFVPGQASGVRIIVGPFFGGPTLAPGSYSYQMSANGVVLREQYPTFTVV